MTSHIFIYSHPRTASNLFLRLLEGHPSLTVIKNPFMDAFRFGPGRLLTRTSPVLDEFLAQNPKVGEAIFQDSLDQMERRIKDMEAQGKTGLFKEHTFQLMYSETVNANIDRKREERCKPVMVDHFLDVAEDSRSRFRAELPPSLPIPNPTFLPDRLFVAFRPIIIIRHPVRTIPSYLRAVKCIGGSISDADMAVENQFKWQRMVYDCYKAWYEAKGVATEFPVVVDGDKLVQNTQEQMEKLCRILGLDVTDTKYSWEAASSFPNIAHEHFGGTIGRSTGVIRKKETFEAPVLDDEVRKWAEEWDGETARVMKNYAERAMADFEFLLKRSI